MKRRTKVVGFAAIGLVVAFAWPVYTHYRAKARLAEYRRFLEGAGEELRVDEVAQPRPSPESVAAGGRLISAISLLGNSPSSETPPMMKHLGGGRALVAWRQEVYPLHQSTTNPWAAIQAELEPNRAAMAQLRAASRAPEVGFILDYKAGPSMPLPHLVKLKAGAQWLSPATLCNLHQRRWDEAYENCLALSSLPHAWEDEPVVISTLVRLAISQIAIVGCWEALQGAEWNDAQWAELKRVWKSVDFLEQAERALSMERASSSRFYDEARRSYAMIDWAGAMGGSGPQSGFSELIDKGKELIENPEQGLREFARRYPGYWHWVGWQSYEDELVSLKSHQAALEALRSARQGKPLALALREFEDRLSELDRAYPRSGRYLHGDSGTERHFSRRFLDRVLDIRMQQSLLVTAIALKRFELRHGRRPPNLDALVPDCIDRLPEDLDGKPLRYVPGEADAWKLYSLGIDRKDDGGSTEAGAGEDSGNTNRWTRLQDAVWPKPATPEQEAAAFAELQRQYRRESKASDNFRRRYGLPTSQP